MTSFAELLAQTAARHDHLCPRQVIGVRMGMYAAKLLELALPQSDKRLLTFVETDGCFADGVSVATGCSLGHRTLRLMDFGKVAATFVDTNTERAVRIFPHAESRSNARLWLPDARSRWHAQLEAYQVMPVERLLCWQPVTLTIALQQLISRPGVRVNCAVCGEEIINEREVIVDGQAICRTCAGDYYYQVGSDAFDAVLNEVVQAHAQ
ncbi:MAG: TraR/DksA C4-type zinc finger protein [Chloroflexi bacterium]|nr:TraR/DksA C4-type zinc finger protein [Chloroflexota bacterium]